MAPNKNHGYVHLEKNNHQVSIKDTTPLAVPASISAKRLKAMSYSISATIGAESSNSIS